MQAPLPGLKALFLLGLVSILTACGGGGGSDNPPPPPPPPPPASGDTPATPALDETAATLTVDTNLGIREDIVLTFDEPMDPDSLDIIGLLSDIADDGTWSNDNKEFRLTPLEGAWESGVQNLSGSVQDVAGNTTDINVDFEIRLVFENFQEATTVIGQPDFESNSANQGSALAANTLDRPEGAVSFSNGRMWISDHHNYRMLGFDGVPVSSNVSATWVVGQPDFASDTVGVSESEFRPRAGLEHEDRFYVVDDRNHRVLIYDHIPLSPPGEASNVIGQADLTAGASSCAEDRFARPSSIEIVDGKLIVSEEGNHRVLIWNSVPVNTNGQPADLVIGQGNMDTCEPNDDDHNGSSDAPTARTLNGPTAVWSDGTRLIVSDTFNNRVLIWKTFPTTTFQPADVVLGQSEFSNVDPNDGGAPNSQTLSYPSWGIWSNGIQLAVSDTENRRVLLWDEFPSENFQPADAVLGQGDFVNVTPNDDNQDTIADTPSARTMNYPGGLEAHRDKLILLDMGNNRALVFRSQ